VPGDTNDANLLQPVGLDLNRHQALLTVGYKFKGRHERDT